MKELPLTQGKVALIDDEDYERACRLKWRARRDKKTWYAETGPIDEQLVFLHNFILQTPPGYEGEHRDGNGLDNRRKNLRIATRSQNCMNRKGWSMHGYKGVYKISTGVKYGARLQINKKMIQIGCFYSPEEAARAYDVAALRYHGEFARLNFPLTLPPNAGILSSLAWG